MIDSNTRFYCLIGHPVSKSLSPLIHNISFSYNKMNAVYTVFDVSKDKLKDAVAGIRALGIDGFNVTVPHKVDIINYIDELSEEAKFIGAVNTVKNCNGKLIGYNTDGLGFIESLKENKICLKDKKILILGAGGAARAISMTIAKEQLSELIILNRTVEKAKWLIKEIKSKFPNIKCTYDDLKNNKNMLKNTDIIINCTTAGMYPFDELLPIETEFLSNKTVVCDIVYKPLKTKLMEAAIEKGCKTIGGLDMLIYQGIISERIWFNQNIDINSVKKILESRIIL